MGLKVIHAVTVPRSLDLMNGQLRYLKGKGFEAKALCSSGLHAELYKKSEKVDILNLEMEREISLFQDSRSLFNCIQLLRRESPAIVNAGTPKAGLVVMLAARICNVPVRIYTVRGLRLETTEGAKRELLLKAERLAASAATHVFAVSESIKERLIDLKIADEKKIKILGKGSSNGFDVSKFKRAEQSATEITRMQQAIGLPGDSLVLGYVGRLTKDKGINELVDIFIDLRKEISNLKLLLVGDFEEADSIREDTKDVIQNHEDIIHFDYQQNPVPFFQLMDVFVLLSKREGFSNVLVEATLAGVPPVATAVTGTTDTIVDGQTGYLVRSGDMEDVKEKVGRLLKDSELRQQFTRQGRTWAEENFSNEVVWLAMSDFYNEAWEQFINQAKKYGKQGTIRLGKQ